MAKKKSTVSASLPRPDPSNSDSNRIEAQRVRLWEVNGIIETVSTALDRDGEKGDEAVQASPLWWSLRAASQMIADINHELDLVGRVEQ